MYNLSDLKYPKGARFKKTRVGRGTSSGIGKTCGRGHKGQNSRTGGGTRPGFEGGQTPLYRRLPKRDGFKNLLFKKHYAILNLGALNQFQGEVNPDVLEKAGLIKNGEMIKILAGGKLEKALTVKAHKFSEEAAKKISAAGGKVEVCQAQ
ncbi:MAG: 50S ribosomal protein L15 [Candidatus Saganbacteria bacterium]|nr:50S ribosomal protein L15 [Candidatus Saganbacteria bacterium]